MRNSARRSQGSSWGTECQIDASTTVRVGPQKSIPPNGGVRRWLLHGQPEDLEGPHTSEHGAHKHSWWQVMCLTGVDYFSTLGYQPGIAALAAASLAPMATLVLVLVTLFGALPMYRRVAAESPHGDGSISMLERLLSWWQGKILVLVLISFVLTAFVVTITISASDAAAHITENPFGRSLVGYEIPVTLGLILLLGIFFLRGFSEAIGVAVGIVALYLALNVVVLARAYWEIGLHPVSARQLARFASAGIQQSHRHGADRDLPLSAAGAWALRVRDRGRRHAAGQGLRDRRSAAAGVPHPEHGQVAHGRGVDHERDADLEQPRDDAAHPARGVRRGW